MAHRRHLPDLPALVRRQLGRRHRRPARHHARASTTSSTLGVDALWLSPFQRSPQKDAGYDVADYCDVDPLFGTLADFDDLLAAAHGRGIRVIVDLVPNHSSDQHVWFQAGPRRGARAAAERARYMFRDGKGEHGELPPNNWESVFGGPAWTRVDRGRRHARPVVPAPVRLVAARLRLVERRGARGVPRHPALLARPRRRRLPRRRRARPHQGRRPARLHPARRGRLDGRRRGRRARTGARTACTTSTATGTSCSPSTTATARCAPRRGCPRSTKTALWVRPDEMHQAFNFAYLETGWDAAAAARRHRRVAARLRRASARRARGCSPTTTSCATPRASRSPPRTRRATASARDSAGKPIADVGLRRARAATALMLALPGSAYLYQGEELGLPEVVDLPDAARQDPTWFRTDGERYGRDGCRVPIPWTADAPAYGFSPTGESWLPQPAEWAHARPRRAGRRPGLDPGALPHAARGAPRARSRRGHARVARRATATDVVAFRNGDVTVVANIGATRDRRCRDGSVIAASGPIDGDELCRSTPPSGSSDDQGATARPRERLERSDDVVSIDEVARLAGVSTATVSRALSGRGHVSDADARPRRGRREDARLRRLVVGVEPGVRAHPQHRRARAVPRPLVLQHGAQRHRRRRSCGAGTTSRCTT